MFSVAGTFIFFLDHFRLYSTFCASHYQAQEVLRELSILHKYIEYFKFVLSAIKSQDTLVTQIPTFGRFIYAKRKRLIFTN